MRNRISKAAVQRCEKVVRSGCDEQTMLTHTHHACLMSLCPLCCCRAGLLNISLGYSGPAGAFCAGRSIGDVLAQGNGCKAEVRRAGRGAKPMVSV